MTTKPRAFITSVDVRPSNGGHEYVTIFVRGQNVGTLCVGKGDAQPLALLLLPGMSPEEARYERDDADEIADLRRRERERRAALAVDSMPRVIGIDPAGADHRMSTPLVYTSVEAWYADGCPVNARIVADARDPIKNDPSPGPSPELLADLQSERERDR